MIESSKTQIQNEDEKGVTALATLSDSQLALVGGGSGDVLWG
jgi:hypothetical protein